MDCEKLHRALIEGEPGPAERDHALGCPACARLLVITAPAPEPASAPLPLRVGLRARRAPVLLAVAAVVCLGVLGARAAFEAASPTPMSAAPPAGLQARDVPLLEGLALDDALDDPSGDDPFASPTDILSTAVLHRSHP